MVSTPDLVAVCENYVLQYILNASTIEIFILQKNHFIDLQLKF